MSSTKVKDLMNFFFFKIDALLLLYLQKNIGVFKIKKTKTKKSSMPSWATKQNNLR
jgi:hypothetical protein